MRLPLHREMRSDSPALHAEQFRVQTKDVRSLHLLDGISEIPQEQCHKSRRTLMSQQEREIAWCSPNQLEMTLDSHAMSPEQSPIPHHT